VSAIIQRHMVGKRESIRVQVAQPAILDSRSVLHQQQCQPVSWKVHGGQKRGETNKWDPSSPTCYLLLNSSNLGRSTEGTCTFCFSPLNFVSKKLPRTSLFCHKASANQPIQVKPTLLSLFVLDWTQWGFLLLWGISFDSRECGAYGHCISLFPCL
jgi:hypothetical protein